MAPSHPTQGPGYDDCPAWGWGPSSVCHRQGTGEGWGAGGGGKQRGLRGGRAPYGRGTTCRRRGKGRKRDHQDWASGRGCLTAPWGKSCCGRAAFRALHWSAFPGERPEGDGRRCTHVWVPSGSSFVLHCVSRVVLMEAGGEYVGTPGGTRTAPLLIWGGMGPLTCLTAYKGCQASTRVIKTSGTYAMARRRSRVRMHVEGQQEQLRPLPPFPLPQHPDPCSSHLSQRFAPKHHSLLQPRLPNPSRLGCPGVGNGYITPAFSGVPNTGTKNGEKGGQLGGNSAKLCPARPAHAPAAPPWA